MTIKCLFKIFFVQILILLLHLFCFFVFLFVCFYSVVLVSAIQQRESTIIICIAPLSLVSVPSSHPIPPDHYRAPGWLPVLHSNFLPAMHLTKCFSIADLNTKSKKNNKLLIETYIITLEEKIS